MSVLDRIDRLAGSPSVVARLRAALRKKHGRTPTLRELLREVMQEHAANARRDRADKLRS